MLVFASPRVTKLFVTDTFFLFFLRMLDLVSLARPQLHNYSLTVVFFKQIAKFVKDTEKGADMIIKMNRKFFCEVLLFNKNYTNYPVCFTQRKNYGSREIRQMTSECWIRTQAAWAWVFPPPARVPAQTNCPFFNYPWKVYSSSILGMVHTI